MLHVKTYEILRVKSIKVFGGKSHHKLDVVDDGVGNIIQVDGRRHGFKNFLKLKRDFK